MSFLKTKIPHSILEHVDVEISTDDLNTGIGLIWDDIKGKFVPKTLTTVDAPGTTGDVIFNRDGNWAANENLKYNETSNELVINNGTVKRAFSYTESISLVVANATPYRIKIFDIDTSTVYPYFVEFYVYSNNDTYMLNSSITVVGSHTNDPPGMCATTHTTDPDSFGLISTTVERISDESSTIYLTFQNATGLQQPVYILVTAKSRNINTSVEYNYNPQSLSTFDLYIKETNFSANNLRYIESEKKLVAYNIEAMYGETNTIEIVDKNDVTHIFTFRGGVLYDYTNSEESSSS